MTLLGCIFQILRISSCQIESIIDIIFNVEQETARLSSGYNQHEDWKQLQQEYADKYCGYQCGVMNKELTIIYIKVLLYTTNVLSWHILMIAFIQSVWRKAYVGLTSGKKNAEVIKGNILHFTHNWLHIPVLLHPWLEWNFRWVQ